MHTKNQNLFKIASHFLGRLLNLRHDVSTQRNVKTFKALDLDPNILILGFIIQNVTI